MEYEISDQDDDALFDDSTNPSLRHPDATPARSRPRASPQGDSADERKPQTAELIPEEEEQLA